MAHDVFLSHSSKDKAIADGICANIEASGIRCWIAPRDIAAGDDWPTAIANAIAQSRIMVLIFSANSNSSDQISRELSLAANANLVILPFKIENVMPEPGKLYYLARTHWLDAMNPPTQAQINMLVERVGAILSSISESKITPTASSSLPLPATVFPRKAERPRWLVGAIVGAVSALVVGILAVAFWLGGTNSGMVAQAVASVTPTKAPTSNTVFTPTAIATITLTPILTVTPTPTNTPTAVPTSTRSDDLVEERFNGDSINSSDWSVNCNSPNARVSQANGSLSIAGPCTITRLDAAFSAAEMAYAEVDLRVSKPQGNPSLSSEEWVHGHLNLNLDRPDSRIQCKLLVGFPRDFAAPYLACSFSTGGVLEYETPHPFIKLQFDTWYKSRIEIDPNTSEIRFFLDGKLTGNYTPKDANFAKSALFTPAIGVSSNVSDVAFTASFDNFVIRSRSATITPIPSPTQTDYYIEERFENPIDRIWWFPSCKTQTASVRQMNGVLRMTGRCDMGRRPSEVFFAKEMQYVEVDIQISKPQEDLKGGWAYAALNLECERLGLQLGCDVGVGADKSQTAPHYECGFTQKYGQPREYLTPYIMLQFDTWYKSRIEIDPNTSEIRFFLDGKLIGHITPQDTEAIKLAQFAPSIVVNVSSSVSDISITGSFDNFVIRRR